MKIIVILMFGLLLKSSLAFAEGYLTVKQPVHRSTLGNDYGYYPYNDNYNPDISIFITEPLTKDWTFMSWNGYVTGNTFVFDQSVAYTVNPSLRLGIGVNYSDGQIPSQNLGDQRYQNFEGKVWGEYKLW